MLHFRHNFSTYFFNPSFFAIPFLIVYILKLILASQFYGHYFYAFHLEKHACKIHQKRGYNMVWFLLGNTKITILTHSNRWAEACSILHKTLAYVRDIDVLTLYFDFCCFTSPLLMKTCSRQK